MKHQLHPFKRSHFWTALFCLIVIVAIIVTGTMNSALQTYAGEAGDTVEFLPEDVAVEGAIFEISTEQPSEDQMEDAHVDVHLEAGQNEDTDPREEIGQVEVLEDQRLADQLLEDPEAVQVALPDAEPADISSELLSEEEPVFVLVGTSDSSEELEPTYAQYHILGGESVLLADVLASLEMEQETYSPEQISQVYMDADPDAAAEEISADEMDAEIIQLTFDVNEDGDADYSNAIITAATSLAGDAADGTDSIGNADLTGKSQSVTVEFANGDLAKILFVIAGKSAVENGGVIIRSVEGIYLPDEASADAAELEEEEASAATEAVEELEALEALVEARANDPATMSVQSGRGPRKAMAAAPAATDAQTTDSSEDSASQTAASPIGQNSQAFSDTTNDIPKYKVFDISLNGVDETMYPEGFEVSVQLPEALVGRNFELYHIHDGQTQQIVDSLVLDGYAVDGEDGLEAVTGFRFVTDGFSEFVLRYTVDFHYEVNGKMYDFSIPGGGFVSLEHVVEVLGIAGSGENGRSAGALSLDNAENDTESVSEDGNEFVGKVSGIDLSDENSTANDTAYEASIKLNEVEVSEAAKKFVADVADVQFSTPSLVDVSKVEQDATVGAIKEARGLDVEYSADLTEEQIAKINNSTVEAGDWALISVQPFSSEESLTVRMVNGDMWTVKVTDAASGAYIEYNDSSMGIVYRQYNSSAGATNPVSNKTTVGGRTNMFFAPNAGYDFACVDINGSKYFPANWSSYGFGIQNYYRIAQAGDSGGKNLWDNASGTLQVKVYFKPTGSFILNYVAGENGTINRTEDFATTASYSAQGVTATPEEGYKFAGWWIGETKLSENATLTASDLAASNFSADFTEITAKFEEDKKNDYYEKYYYRVNVEGVGNKVNQYKTEGGVSGESIEIESNPKTGNSKDPVYPTAGDAYVFVNWTNDGVIYRNETTVGEGVSSHAIKPLWTEAADQYNGYHFTGDTFIANFKKQNTFMVNVVADEHGSIADGEYYITTDDTEKTITAVPDEDYEFIGWYDEEGNLVCESEELTAEDLPDGLDSDITLHARFQTIFTIWYSVLPSGWGYVSIDEESFAPANGAKGATATPANTRNRFFVCWIDDNDMPVSYETTFVPTGEYVANYAEYRAVFTNTEKNISVSVNNPMYGSVIGSSNWTSGGFPANDPSNIVVARFTDDGTKLRYMLEASAMNDENYEFDHWEMNGIPVRENGELAGKTLKAGFDFSEYNLVEGTNKLIAVFKEKGEEKPKWPITIYLNSGDYGYITSGRTDAIVTDKLEVKVYSTGTFMIGDQVINIPATATANSGYEFVGWYEQVAAERDKEGGGTETVYTTQCLISQRHRNFEYVTEDYINSINEKDDKGKDISDAEKAKENVFTVDNLKDGATYTAMFRPSKSGSNVGVVGYNTNLPGVDVTWPGVHDMTVRGDKSDSIMYYDTNGGKWYSYKGTEAGNPKKYFTLPDVVPEAKGYLFIGWFDKDRPISKDVQTYKGYTVGSSYNEGQYVWTGTDTTWGNSNGQYKKSAELIKREDLAGGKTFLFNYATGDRYSLDAIWLKLLPKDIVVPYDGFSHQPSAGIELETGALTTTSADRWSADLKTMLGNGKIKIIPNSMGFRKAGSNDEYSKTYGETEPGEHEVDIKMLVEFDGVQYPAYTSAKVTIYAAQETVIKQWNDQNNAYNIRPDELVTTLSIGQGSGKTDAFTNHNEYGESAAEWDTTSQLNQWTKVYNNIQIQDYNSQGSGAAWDDNGVYQPLTKPVASHLVYSADEDEVPIGYRHVSTTTVSSDAAFNNNTSYYPYKNYTTTIVNELILNDIAIKKIDSTGTELNGAHFTLKRRNVNGDYVPLKKNGTAVYTDIVVNGTTPIKDLPDGIYELTETQEPEGFNKLSDPIYIKIQNNQIVVTDTEGLEFTGTSPVIVEDTTIKVKNEPAGIDVTLKKVDKDNLNNDSAETLKDAAFKIEKFTDATYKVKETGWTELSLTDIEKTGIYSMTGLGTGYYKIVETAFPTGYVKTGDAPKFRVKVDSETGSLIVVVIKSDGTEADDGKTEILRVSNKTLILGNEPGVALPSTGGPGTRLFTILGSILTALAGTGLVIKRRRRALQVNK